MGSDSVSVLISSTLYLGVTSADAAGLAIPPGLVRCQEVFGDPDQELELGINHAIRVTLNSIQRAYIRPANMFVSGAHHDNWDDDQLRQLRDIKVSDFEAVYTGEIIDY